MVIPNNKGQAAVDYILTIVVVVLVLAGILYGPDMQNAISQFYTSVAERVIKPGK